MSNAIKLEKFEGRWNLSRVITDRHNGAEGRLQGTATFSSADGGLHYEEEGRLIYGSQPEMVAKRQYWWRQGEGRIDVLFEDGSPFHAIKTDKLMPDDTHLCGADLYDVNYDFTGWPAWKVTWGVLGPKKDYRMVSYYSWIGGQK